MFSICSTRARLSAFDNPSITTRNRKNAVRGHIRLESFFLLQRMKIDRVFDGSGSKGSSHLFWAREKKKEREF